MTSKSSFVGGNSKYFGTISQQNHLEMLWDESLTLEHMRASISNVCKTIG